VLHGPNRFEPSLRKGWNGYGERARRNVSERPHKPSKSLFSGKPLAKPIKNVLANNRSKF
jgi:hypothetical protein